MSAGLFDQLVAWVVDLAVLHSLEDCMVENHQQIEMQTVVGYAVGPSCRSVL